MAVAYFIWTTSKPLNLVEDEAFRRMLKCFRPGYEPCGRKALTDNYLSKLYNTTRELIQCGLREALFITITTDAWTSGAGESYMALTAHFVDSKWKLQNYTLCCRVLNVDHTGINIKDWLQETLLEWKIDLEKVVCATSDNGENIRLAIDIIKIPHVRCIGHTLQNGVAGIEKLDEVISLRKRTHALQHLFSSTKIWNRYASFINERYQIKPRMLPGLCPTRWWSELPLNKVLMQDVNYHREFLAHYNNGSHMNLLLKENEMELLKIYTQTLDPLEEITTAMSGEHYVTASALLPVVYLLDKTLKEAQATTNTSTAADSVEDSEAAAVGAEQVAKVKSI